MRGYIFGDAANTSTWRVYVPAHCLVLSMRGGHLQAEIDNTDRVSEKVRDIEVPIAIVQKARRVINEQKNLDSHTGWARATLQEG